MTPPLPTLTPQPWDKRPHGNLDGFVGTLDQAMEKYRSKYGVYPTVAFEWPRSPRPQVYYFALPGKKDE